MSILSPDAEYFIYSGASQSAPEDLTSYVKMALPSAQVRYEYADDIRADGELAISMYSYVYTSKITGKETRYRGCDVMTICDGKIIKVHEYSSVADTPPEEKNRERLALDDHRLNTLAGDLKDYFDQHQPYLDSALKLEGVAKALGCTRNQLSYLFNHVFDTRFYDYISEARIDYLLAQLNEENKNNISDIALDSGFNSLTTFYKFFKKRTGLTPKAYIKQLQS